MSFFPLSSSNFALSKDEIYETRYETEPLRDGERYPRSILKQCRQSDNSKGLPSPSETKLSYQLRVGANLKDYAGNMFMSPRELTLSDEQAQQILDTVLKSEVKQNE